MEDWIEKVLVRIGVLSVRIGRVLRVRFGRVLGVRIGLAECWG